MQSSRQKKRSSQQKKRHHERAKKNAGAEASVERSEKKLSATETVQKKTCSEVAPSDQSKQLGLYKDGDVVDRQKFPALVQGKEPATLREEETCRLQEDLEEVARKKEEEQLQQRLLQLLSMPIQHDPTSRPPVVTSTSISLTSSLTSSFLTLNCGSLADSLSTLPLHDRLCIDPTLLDLEGLPPLDKSSGMWVTSKDEAQIRNKIDLTVCSKRNKPERFEFDKMTANLRPQGDKGGQSSDSRVLAGAVSSQLVVGKASTDDVELQRLLNRNLSVGTGLSSQQSLASSTTATPPTTEEPVPELSYNFGFNSDKRSFPGIEIVSTSTVASGASPMEEMSEHVPIENAETVAENTDELDDMLDELLS